MAIHDSYTKEILEQLNYNATWLPTVQLAPGDLCDLRGHEMQVVSNLAEFEIPFELEDPAVETDIEYSSEGAVSINFKASGDPPPAGSLLDLNDAGVSLSFSRSQAVVLRMAKCSSRRIKSRTRRIPGGRRRGDRGRSDPAPAPPGAQRPRNAGTGRPGPEPDPTSAAWPGRRRARSRRR